MPFFLPSRLIDFEYLSGEPDPSYERIAKPFQQEIDFAFFASNFGYSKSDYEAVTRKELAFLRKALENRMITQTTMLYNAIYTAVYNAMRPKNKRALPLWRKRRMKKANTEIVTENLRVVQEVESREGKEWVRRIYQANGLTPPERR